MILLARFRGCCGGTFTLLRSHYRWVIVAPKVGNGATITSRKVFERVFGVGKEASADVDFVFLWGIQKCHSVMKIGIFVTFVLTLLS